MAILFYSFHLALTMYSSSSFFGEFISENLVGLLYAGAAAITLLITRHAATYLNKFSNYNLLISFFIIEGALLFTIAEGTSMSVVVVAFIAHQVLIGLIFIALNIAIEELSKKEEMGTIRGAYLMVMSVGVLVAAFVSGFVFEKYGYQGIWYGSVLLIIPALLFLVYALKHLQEPRYKTPSARGAVLQIIADENIRSVWLSQFLLEMFYGILIIYSPLYLLTQGIGLDIYLSIILPIILIPFILLPYPLGKLADKILGEKEILMGGFLIAAFGVFALVTLSTTSIIPWIVALLVGRIGATLIESMNASYFFKQVHKDDAAIIAAFTNTRSIALLIAPFISFIILTFFDLRALFLVLGTLLLCGVYIVSKIEDTK